MTSSEDVFTVKKVTSVEESLVGKVFRVLDSSSRVISVTKQGVKVYESIVTKYGSFITWWNCEGVKTKTVELLKCNNELKPIDTEKRLHYYPSGAILSEAYSDYSNGNYYFITYYDNEFIESLSDKGGIYWFYSNGNPMFEWDFSKCCDAQRKWYEDGTPVEIDYLEQHLQTTKLLGSISLQHKDCCPLIDS